jgi:hypothetical protein
MQRPTLAIAEHMREGENARFSRSKQFLGGKFRRAMQAKPLIWVSFPGETWRMGVSTSVKPWALKKCRAASCIFPRALSLIRLW